MTLSFPRSSLTQHIKSHVSHKSLYVTEDGITYILMLYYIILVYKIELSPKLLLLTVIVCTENTGGDVC